nr:hypothetical protein [Xenococcaceae cyanobacterium MO_234.B1]
YLQIVKNRVKRKLKTVKKFWVKGSEKDFPVGTQNTSYWINIRWEYRLISRHNAIKSYLLCPPSVLVEKMVLIAKKSSTLANKY